MATTLSLTAQATRPHPLDPRPNGPGTLSSSGALVVPARKSAAHNNCASCHQNHHAAQGSDRKLAKAATADQLCLPCHDSALATTSAGIPLKAAPDVTLAPKLPSSIGDGSGHMRGRFGSRRAEGYVRTILDGKGRQVRLALDCMGCHDSHGKERGKLRSSAFDARGQRLDRRPQVVAEICFSCHAGQDAAPLPSGNPDLGQLFSKSAASSHTIGATAAGRPELPSLRTSAFKGRLDCTSCHDNPDPFGARGPHASPNVSILKAPFGREKDMSRLGDRVNDLCFLCHDKASILANQSFPFHGQHLSGFTSGGAIASRQGGLIEAQAALGVRSVRDLGPGRGGAYAAGHGEPTACATCHASHGSLRQAALVEFDRSVVSASSLGAPVFQRSGLGHGTCTLTCHGHDHVQSRY
jgi:predicted CXXCH cytochrome family protein